MFCKALLFSALYKIPFKDIWHEIKTKNFKTNEMGSMLSTYETFITDFVSISLWVMAIWLLNNCSTILSRFFCSFSSNCCHYSFGVFYPIFTFEPAFESPGYPASSRAYLIFVWGTPNIYIYILAYIYIYPIFDVF